MLAKGLAAGVVLALAWAGTAAADTFCVHHAGCPASNHNFATIQAAVNAAAGNNAPSPTKDRILVGPGSYPNFTANSGNPVEVAGSGQGTVVAWPTANADSATVVSIADPSSEIHDAAVRMAIGSGDGGVNSTGTLTRVRVFAPGAETNGVGVFGGVVRDSSVSVPGTATGVNSASLIQRSDITANVGVDASFVFGTSSVEDSVVHTLGPFAYGARLSTMNTSALNLRHVDLLGDGSPNSVGVQSATNSIGTSASATVDVRSSIIRGFAQNFSRVGSTSCGAANPGCAVNPANCPPDCTPPTFPNPASLTVAYSDIGPAPTPDTDTGPGTFNETSPGGNTTVAPRFVSPTDLHLRHDSALIDKGDSASPAAGESQTDRAGLPRKVDGNSDGIARADIGAFEYQRLAPRVFAAAHPTAAKKQKPVTFTATTVDDPGDTIVSYKWKFDDGTAAFGRTVHHSFKKPGIHRGTLTVTDVTGRKGTGSAKVFVGPVKILSASISPSSFKAGHKTTIAYDLSASAPITVAISRCNSSGAKCKHKVGQLITSGHTGANKLHWNGRITGGALAAGHYRAVVVAGTGSVKTRSQPLPFQILSP